jgi:FixJ family two-component response regulator
MSASSAPGQSKSSPKSHATPIVFVVDDDISVRESLELLIRSEGWEPETFASAQEFLAHPRALVASCLVLDVSLPGLNGLELQKRIAVERTDMPIIFITGHGNVPMSVQAMKAGAAEFLTKPFGTDVLLKAIRHALERSRAALVHQAEMQRLRHQRNYGEGASRPRDAENEGRFARRPGENGRETPPRGFAERLTFRQPRRPLTVPAPIERLPRKMRSVSRCLRWL